MATSHAPAALSSPDAASAFDRLVVFVRECRRAREAPDDFAEFEARLHLLMMDAERELVGEQLARYDVDVPLVVVEGVPHRRAVRCEAPYLTSAGEVRVERTLYRQAQGEPAVCPLEVKAGIVEGWWTPRAAELASFTVAHLTPQEGEELFRRLGGMAPSKSSLDRLAKDLSVRWEADRASFERALLEWETPVPPEAVTVAVSLDGVMVPLKDGQRAQKRAETAAQGRPTKGPAGYGEASCATVSFYDSEGERLGGVRFARMPEPKKKALKGQLLVALAAILKARPDLQVVKVADGAADNWEFLAQELPAGVEVVDFYHAAEHLKAALDVAYGENTPMAKAEFERLRSLLRHDPQGVGKVIRALAHQRKLHPKRLRLRRELGYFRKHRARMKYATWAAAGLPIGSGVVEAACKTLVTQRLKRAGMRWRREGGQAILTLRSLVQSGWWDFGWGMLAEDYKRRVEVPENVLAMPSRKAA